MRLFVAVLLEPAFIASLTTFQGQLRRLDPSGCVRWVDPRGIHLTLKFLGEVPESRLEPLCTALSRAIEGLPAPELMLAAPGAFPSANRPRVVWVGVGDTQDRLLSLALAVDEAVSGLGWERERRAFQPHLTVGRVREQAKPEAARAIVQACDGIEMAAGKGLPHPRVALMRSHLGPSGARYEELRVWLLE